VWGESEWEGRRDRLAPPPVAQFSLSDGDLREKESDKERYSDTSLARNRHPHYDRPRTIGIVLL
jgi:hypothetical protein